MKKVQTYSKLERSYSNLNVILWLMIFFPVGIYRMWRYTTWKTRVKLYISGFFFLLVFLFSAAAQLGNKDVRTQSNQNSVETKVIAPTKVPKPKEEKTIGTLERIEDIIREKTGGIEATIFSGDTLANKNNAPYDIVINYPLNHSISNCLVAKTVSHEIVKTLYTDSFVRSDIDRVMITIPNYLRMSLGASDGSPMGEKSMFNGPSLFWKTLIDSTGNENETGDIRDRTWGVLLDKCE